MEPGVTAPIRLRRWPGVLILATALVVAGMAVAAVRHGRGPHPVQSLTDSASITALAYSPDGRVIAASDEDGFTYLRDARTGRVLRRLRDPSPESVDALAYRPDGKVLATVDDDDKIVLWNTSTGRQMEVLRDPDVGNFGLTSVAFSPGGVLLAAGDNYGGAYLWNTATGHQTAQLAFPAGQSSQWTDPTMVAFSPDENVVAIASKAGIVLSSASTGRELRRIPGFRDAYVYGLAFSPDGRMLVAGINDGADVWSVATLNRLAALSSSTCAGSTGLAISPDGRLLATGAGTAYTGAACVWNLTSRKLDVVFPDPAGFEVDAVAFSPDDELLATGDDSDGNQPASQSPRILIWKDARA